MCLSYDEFPALYDSKIAEVIITTGTIPNYAFTFIDALGVSSNWFVDLYADLFNGVYHRTTNVERIGLYRSWSRTMHQLISR